MTEYVRKLDSLGRLVLPADYRKKAGIGADGEVRITECDGKIIIEKLHPACKICGETEKLNKKFQLCENCIKEIKNSK